MTLEKHYLQMIVLGVSQYIHVDNENLTHWRLLFSS